MLACRQDWAWRLFTLTLQHQHRLDGAATVLMVERYRSGTAIRPLATEFGVHRTTVATPLHRYRVEMRQGGLSEGQVDGAGQFYGDGWSLAKIGNKFGVGEMTVRRHLLLGGVVMWSPN
jgi:transposase